MTIAPDASGFTANPSSLTSFGQPTMLSVGALTNIGTEIVDVTFQIDQPSSATFSTPSGPSTIVVAKSQTVDGVNPVQHSVSFASGSGFVGLTATLVSQNDGSQFHRGTAVMLPFATGASVAAFASAAQAAAHAASAHAFAAKTVADDGGSMSEVAAHTAAAGAASAAAAAHAASAQHVVRNNHGS